MSGSRETSSSAPDLSASAWDKRWREKNTGWDLGGVTPALIAWVKDHPVSKTAVLVPGCGSGYDAHYLAKQGADTVALDFSSSALEHARSLHPDSRVRWLEQDVTRLAFDAAFDLVWEYTCFVALHPHQREAYLAGLARALRPGGRYLGMVFQAVPNPDQGPPFQVDPDDFRALLERFFTVERIQVPAPHSIKPRRGAEIWFEVCRAP